MRVELTRVRVKPGKSGRVDEWLAMLNSRMDEVKETLVREEMHVEVIFRELIGEDAVSYTHLDVYKRQELIRGYIDSH